MAANKESDDRDIGVDVATGTQDAQTHADLSTDELEEELEAADAGAPHDRAHSPRLSGGDVEAAWDQSDSGEETVGGSSPTPDQDQVDALGEAVGVTYSDEEPLHTTEKVERRDDDRWELDPASSEDYPERQREMNDPRTDEPPRRHTGGDEPPRRNARRDEPQRRGETSQRQPPVTGGSAPRSRR